jgi:hypothetical protein
MLCYSKYVLMMDYLDLIDLFHELASIYAISFVIIIYLIFIIGIQTSDVTGLKFSHRIQTDPKSFLMFPLWPLVGCRPCLAAACI